MSYLDSVNNLINKIRNNFNNLFSNPGNVQQSTNNASDNTIADFYNKTATQNYYNNQKADLSQQMTSLLQKKYGFNNSYNIEDGFYQNGRFNNQSLYNSDNEKEDYLTYQKLYSDYQNLNNTEQQYNDILVNQGKNQSIQGSAKEISEKYIDSQLKAQGLGNQGISESSKVSIANQYANAIANINNQASNNIADLYSNYMNSKNSNQLVYDENIASIRETQKQKQEDKDYSDFSSLLQTAETQEDLDQIKSLYGKYLDNPVDKKAFDTIQQYVNNSVPSSEAEQRDKDLAGYNVDTSNYIDLNNVSINPFGNSAVKNWEDMRNKINNGEFQNGQVIELEDGTNRYYLVYNKKLYVTDRDTYIRVGKENRIQYGNFGQFKSNGKK